MEDEIIDPDSGGDLGGGVGGGDTGGGDTGGGDTGGSTPTEGGSEPSVASFATIAGPGYQSRDFFIGVVEPVSLYTPPGPGHRSRVFS